MQSSPNPFWTTPSFTVRNSPEGSNHRRVRLGESPVDGAAVGITTAELVQHLVLFGRSGMGKSRFCQLLFTNLIESLRFDLRDRSSFVCVDPHGPLFDGVLSHLARHPPRRQIITIDLRDSGSVVGYNPLLLRPNVPANVHASHLIDGILHAWGSANFNETPLLARWLHNTLVALIELRGSLTDALGLLRHPSLAASVADRVTDEVVRQAWQRAATMKPQEFDRDVGSTYSRLYRFLTNAHLRDMFNVGATIGSFRFDQALGDGSIILVCTAAAGGNVSPEQGDTFASLLLADLWSSVLLRGKSAKRPPPCFCMVDEFHRMVNPTIARGLDEARGFGLHFLLSTQYPAQLSKPHLGDSVYRSVLENVSTQIIFGLQDPATTLPMAEQIFGASIDPYAIKDELRATRVVAYEKTTSVSHGITHSTQSATSSSQVQTSGNSRSKGDSTSTGQTSGTGERYVPGDEPTDEGEYVPHSRHADSSATLGTSSSQSENESDALGETQSYSHGESVTTTTSEQLVPVLGKEVSSRQYFTREEVIAQASVLIRSLPPRYAFLARAGFPPVLFRVPNVVDAASAHLSRRFKACRDRLLPFVVPVAEAKRISDLRTRSGVTGARDDVSHEPDSFD